MGDVETQFAGVPSVSSRDRLDMDRLIEQLRHLVEAAERPRREAHGPHGIAPSESLGEQGSSRRRRVAVLGVAAVVATAVFVGVIHQVNRREPGSPRRAFSPATTIGTSAAGGVNADPIPATPRISARAKGDAASSIRIEPSVNATRVGVTHYEVWRRDTTEKSALWQVVYNVQADLVSPRGYVYQDSNESLGHAYAFRAVAVTATERSGYDEIQVTPQG
jgi:hypothetical protein